VRRLSKILPASLYEIDYLVENIRESDFHEVRWMACHTGIYRPGWTPKWAILGAKGLATIWAAWLEDELLGLGGAIPTGRPGSAAIWFIGTQAAERHPVENTRLCRDMVKVWKPHFPVFLGNMVPPHMVERQRWLHKIGFDILKRPDNDPGKPLLFDVRRDGPEEEARPH